MNFSQMFFSCDVLGALGVPVPRRVMEGVSREECKEERGGNTCKFGSR